MFFLCNKHKHKINLTESNLNDSWNSQARIAGGLRFSFGKLLHQSILGGSKLERAHLC